MHLSDNMLAKADKLKIYDTLGVKYHEFSCPNLDNYNKIRFNQHLFWDKNRKSIDNSVSKYFKTQNQNPG